MIDLIGKRFGKLVVLSEYGRNKNRSVTWLCHCDCGNDVVRSSHGLISGNVQSCNCLRGEVKAMPLGESAINSLMATYKRRAKGKEREFTLTKEQFVHLTSSICFYCGEQPTKTRKVNKNTGVYVFNGLDRVDSALGYTIENTVPCCYRCNVMKSDMNQNDFIKHIERIYSHKKI